MSQKIQHSSTSSVADNSGYSGTRYSTSSSSTNLDSAVADLNDHSQSESVFSGSSRSAGALVSSVNLNLKAVDLNSTRRSSTVANKVAQDLLLLGRNLSQSDASTIAPSDDIKSSTKSKIEEAILSASNPIDVDESEIITINGESGTWSNKQEVVNWRGAIPITAYSINVDQNPEVIHKRSDQKLLYEQEIAVRYLRPPTPPPPGDIIIIQEKDIVTPPAPPLVIRQQPPRPETPPPLVIREAPPQPPAPVGQTIITIPGKRLPAPPRKVVIERLAPLPSKPQSVIIERWLPYEQQKRRVVFQKPTEPDPIIPKPRNVIVQWEAPQVVVKKEFKHLGVVRANPVEYTQRYGASLKSHIELPQFVKEIRPPAGIVLAVEHVPSSTHELEGDVEALGLIDLDREGLSEYRSYLSQRSNASASAWSYNGSYSKSSSFSNLNTNIGQLFASMNQNSTVKISRNEAENLLFKLNSQLGRRFGENEARLFFKNLDFSSNRQIGFDEFRRAFLTQF